MSNQHMFNWFCLMVLGLIVACLAYLVVLDLSLAVIRSQRANYGLQCISKCDDYPAIIKAIK